MTPTLPTQTTETTEISRSKAEQCYYNAFGALKVATEGGLHSLPTVLQNLQEQVRVMRKGSSRSKDDETFLDAVEHLIEAHKPLLTSPAMEESLRALKVVTPDDLARQLGQRSHDEWETEKRQQIAAILGMGKDEQAA